MKQTVHAAISMLAAKWSFENSPGMPVHPKQDGVAAWSFDFPQANSGEVDGVFQYLSGPIMATKLSSRITVETTGAVVFDGKTEPTNYGNAPASARFRMAGTRAVEFATWWSNPLCWLLQPSDGQLVVPLVPSQWSNDNGKMGDSTATLIERFQKTLVCAAQVGIVFGGGDFFGHGVRITGGTARFTAENITLT
jgi:hypothetical protein